MEGIQMVETVKSIEIALENELKERDFYQNCSDKTNNPVGKKMFAILADEENDHYEKLQVIHERLSKQGKWPETVSAVVKDTNIKDAIESIPNLAEDAASTTTDDIDAVKIGIIFETNGHKFYRGLAEAAETQSETDFFNRLAAIEYEHLTSLKDSLAFFENPAAWYEEREKPHLD